MLIHLDNTHFGYMSGKGMTNDLFILRMQEEYHDEGKRRCKYLVDLERKYSIVSQ